VETESALPTGAPMDIQLIPKSPREVYVQWIPPPEETWNGHVLGYKVGRSVCSPDKCVLLFLFFSFLFIFDYLICSFKLEPLFLGQFLYR
jgi:hypothetical protein